MDCSILLYDVRAELFLQKISLPNKSRALSWNPQEPLNFTVGNDDGNLYTFDMRNMSRPLITQHDFISAVMDLDYSPTGKEIVAGSYDKTVRIWDKEQVRSREVYHGRRMQQVNAVQFGGDCQFVVTASEDMNLRIWKAKAARPVGITSERHEAALEYREALV
jgi:WD repeat and SOF domain-containing protein 1